MSPLPTDRDTTDSAADHVADHNTLHAEYNTPTHTHSGTSVRGNLGYASATSSQGGITSVVDLTGLTVTVTVNSGERIKILGQGAFATTVADDRVDLWIYEGAAAIARSTVVSPSTAGNSSYVTATVIAILTPSAGSHTYKLRAERGGGTGVATMSAAATVPAFIMVEGIGT